jgi:hypothetical protein
LKVDLQFRRSNMLAVEFYKHLGLRDEDVVSLDRRPKWAGNFSMDPEGHVSCSSFLVKCLVTICDLFLCFLHVRRHLKSLHRYVSYEVKRMQVEYEMKKSKAVVYYENVLHLKNI